MKQAVNFLTFFMMVMVCSVMVSCSSDDDKDNGGENNGEGPTTSLASQLVGTWEYANVYVYDDGTSASFYYTYRPDNTGIWERRQGSTRWFYEFNYSANQSEGKNWVHMYITNSNMYEDWGIEYKKGRTIDTDFVVRDNKLYIDNMVYTKSN